MPVVATAVVLSDTSALLDLVLEVLVVAVVSSSSSNSRSSSVFFSYFVVLCHFVSFSRRQIVLRISFAGCSCVC